MPRALICSGGVAQWRALRDERRSTPCQEHHTMPDEQPMPQAERELAVIERADLPALFAALRARGYRVLGPTVREDAIVYDEVTGWTTCRLAGPTSRTAGAIGSSGVATPPVRLRRRPALLEAIPASAAAAPVAGRDARLALPCYAGSPGSAEDSPSSASAPASCTRSPSRTACSWAARTSTRLRARGERTSSSSPSIAARPAAPASASR